MLTAEQLADRFRMMPGTKRVSYYYVTNGAYATTPVTLQNAEKRFLSINEQALQGLTTTANHRVWHVWAKQLGRQPVIGDKIVDEDGVSWKVDDVDAQPTLLDQRHRLSCSRFVQ